MILDLLYIDSRTSKGGPPQYYFGDLHFCPGDGYWLARSASVVVLLSSSRPLPCTVEYLWVPPCSSKACDLVHDVLLIQVSALLPWRTIAVDDTNLVIDCNL